MTDKTVFKIKDSVDIFLSDDKYILTYFMNSRRRKTFRVNEYMVKLITCIDGEKNVGDLVKTMVKQCGISPDDVVNAMKILEDNGIITQVLFDQDLLDAQEIQRYTRQINYFTEFLGSELAGIAAQRKLMDSHIFIFGCGAVGSNIAVELAMAGIGHFSLYDYDTVEPSDLSRHICFKEKYIGLLKTEALKNELKSVNSKVIVETYEEGMRPESNIEPLINSGIDFVINTLDEPYIGYTSSKISRVCMKYRIPHYIAGGFDAHLSSTGELIIPFVTPCVECYATHFKETLKGWKPKKHPVSNRSKEIGGLASTSLFSSSYACIEIIKYLAGLVDMDDHFKIRGEFLFQDMSLTYLDVKRNPKCPICGGEETK